MWKWRKRRKKVVQHFVGQDTPHTHWRTTFPFPTAQMNGNYDLYSIDQQLLLLLLLWLHIFSNSYSPKRMPLLLLEQCNDGQWWWWWWVVVGNWRRRRKRRQKKRKGNSLNANWQQRNWLTDWLRVRQWDSQKSEKSKSEGRETWWHISSSSFSRTSCALALRARKTGRQYSIHNLLNSLFSNVLFDFFFSSLCTHTEWDNVSKTPTN